MRRCKTIGKLETVFNTQRPSGNTPLYKTLDILYNYYENKNYENISVTVFTDGEASDENLKNTVLQKLFPNKKLGKYGLCIVMCADDKAILKAWQKLDDEWPLNVMDDLESETTQINKKQGKSWQMNNDTYYVLVLLSPWCPELDSLNEKKMSLKTLNKIAKNFVDKNDPEHKFSYNFIEEPTTHTYKKTRFNLFNLFNCMKRH